MENENVLFILNQFKKYIEPNYKPTKNDIELIKEYLNAKYYSTKVNGMKDFDYEILKEYGVKDFSFIPKYEDMCEETLNKLKDIRRKRYEDKLQWDSI